MRVLLEIGHTMVTGRVRVLLEIGHTMVTEEE